MGFLLHISYRHLWALLDLWCTSSTTVCSVHVLHHVTWVGLYSLMRNSDGAIALLHRYVSMDVTG